MIDRFLPPGRPPAPPALQLPASGPTMDRRHFLLLLGAALPVLGRWPDRPAALPAPFLARGPGGIWGITDQAGDAGGVFLPGARGILGLQPGRGAGAALMRDARGNIAINS